MLQCFEFDRRLSWVKASPISEDNPTETEGRHAWYFLSIGARRILGPPVSRVRISSVGQEQCKKRHEKLSYQIDRGPAKTFHPIPRAISSAPNNHKVVTSIQLKV